VPKQHSSDLRWCKGLAGVGDYTGDPRAIAGSSHRRVFHPTSSFVFIHVRPNLRRITPRWPLLIVRKVYAVFD